MSEKLKVQLRAGSVNTLSLLIGTNSIIIMENILQPKLCKNIPRNEGCLDVLK